MLLYTVLSIVLFVAGFAYRAFINKGQTTATPDEKLYSTYASNWRPGKQYREAVDAFLKKPGLEIPPTRFAFFAVCAAATKGKQQWTQCFKPVTWVATVFGALAAPVAFLVTQDLPSSILVATSPLSLLLGRKALQDTFTAFLLLLAVWGVHLQNAWLLGGAIALALASREAVLLYLPAFLVAWVLKTGDWLIGSTALGLGIGAAVGTYYAVGGRKLLEVFRKLKQPTEYIRRFQSGMPHRLLVDLVLLSPIVMLAVLTNWSAAPLWFVAFVGIALVIHSVITPKNVRFLLVVDLCLRMLCFALPGPWAWTVLALSLTADLWLYRVYGRIEDPVTANLVVKAGMYLEK